MLLTSTIYSSLCFSIESGRNQLAVLIDPDKFNEAEAEKFFNNLPEGPTHFFVGGSTVEAGKTGHTVAAIKRYSSLPVILFPGNYSHITENADALLFLSLISGRNPEYLIEQQVKSIELLRKSKLEIIPTGYILIDGGRQSSVQRISKTQPIPQDQIKLIVDTALAGQYSGKKLIYLEAGSGAEVPVSENIISEIKKAVNIPLIVGGGIKTRTQLASAYNAGADLVVLGTAIENGLFN